MKKLRLAYDGYLFISIIFYIAAVIYLLFPNLSPLLTCCFCGIFLIIYGIIKIVGYFSEDLYCLAFRFDFAFGLALLVVGILMLVKNTSIFQYCVPGLGWIALLDGVVKVQMSVESRRFGLEKWHWILATAVITGVCAFLLILRGFPGPIGERILVAVTLVAGGVSNDLMVAFAVKFPKAPRLREDEQK